MITGVATDKVIERFFGFMALDVVCGYSGQLGQANKLSIRLALA